MPVKNKKTAIGIKPMAVDNALEQPLLTEWLL
jgi:hypothetical protein